MERRNKIKSLLIGSAVGDALGVPVEFMARDFFEVKGMEGYGTHNQPEGTWSDDTSMTLCLAEQIAEGFDIKELGKKFVKWATEGYMTVDGLFDIGIATRRAIRNIRDGIEPSGGTGVRDNGNGSLMRIAPMLFYSTKYEDIKAVSSLTHAHEISVNGCYIFIKYLEELLNGAEKETAYKNVLDKYADDFYKNILEKDLSKTDRDDIKSSGYVVDTLRASIWCFLTTDSYKDAVLKAVNLGDDTDTVGCVTGAIAGLYYGLSNIPEEWYQKLRKKELILDIAERM